MSAQSTLVNFTAFYLFISTLCVAITGQKVKFPCCNLSFCEINQYLCGCENWEICCQKRLEQHIALAGCGKEIC